MPIGAPQVQPIIRPVGATVRPLVTEIPDTYKLDPLTRQVRGIRAFKTLTFTGSADATLYQCSATERLRLNKLFLFVTAQAAISGATNGTEVNVTLYDNSNDTALTFTFFVSQNSVVGANGGLILELDLGEDGWVSSKSGNITVHSDQTLTSGHFRLVALGNGIEAD